MTTSDIAGLTLDPKTHIYRSNGEVVPFSVTGVLKAAGIVDATWFSKTAAESGTRRHYAIHLDTVGDLDYESVDPTDQPYLEAARAFKRDTGWVTHEPEVLLHSQSHECAGQADETGLFPGQNYFTVLDWKTGNHQWYTRLQLAGYVLLAQDPLDPLWNHSDDKQLIGRCEVTLTASGTYQLYQYPVSELKDDIAYFKAALTVAQLKRRYQ